MHNGMTYFSNDDWAKSDNGPMPIIGEGTRVMKIKRRGLGKVAFQ